MTFAQYINSITERYSLAKGPHPEKVHDPIPALDADIVHRIAQGLGLSFVPEKEAGGKVCFVNSPELRDEYKTTFTSMDLLDYSYAFLHSPGHRPTYMEEGHGLPHPKDAETFWQWVRLGGELRQIHTLESPKVEAFVTSYPKDGSNTITRKFTADSPGFEPGDLPGTRETLGRVWINDEQYFEQVPLLAWELRTGACRPAQKWLKDRLGRTLTPDDILHYQKIIAALAETDRLIKQIKTLSLE